MVIQMQYKYLVPFTSFMHNHKLKNFCLNDSLKSRLFLNKFLIVGESHCQLYCCSSSLMKAHASTWIPDCTRGTIIFTSTFSPSSLHPPPPPCWRWGGCAETRRRRGPKSGKAVCWAGSGSAGRCTHRRRWWWMQNAEQSVDNDGCTGLVIWWGQSTSLSPPSSRSADPAGGDTIHDTVQCNV